MHITKKIDRAFQWAGEKMGSEAKTAMTDEFKMLETEMGLRYDGKSSATIPLLSNSANHSSHIQAWTGYRDP